MKSSLFVILVLISNTANAAQVYLCKTNQGATFWASNWCSTVGGITVNAVTVPDGMPFKQQTEMAEQFLRGKNTETAQRDRTREQSFKCKTIDEERAAIWQPYGNAQHVPAERVGRDQTRTRELKAQRANLGCQTQ